MKKLSHRLFFTMGLILGTTSASFSQCTITPAVAADVAVCPGQSVMLEASCNRGLQFNGTNQYVDATNLAPLLANLNFSFSAWIKCGSTSGNNTIFAANTSSGGNRLLFTLNATSGILTLYDGTTQNASTTLVNNNQWHHVAFTYNKTSKQAKTYVDGTLENTLTLSGMPASGIQGASDQISLGQEFDNSSISDLFGGTMDEIRVWNAELTGVDIQNWMDKEIDNTHPNYANLVGYYQLNQYALGSIVDNASSVNDQTIKPINGANWVDITDNTVFNPSCTYSWASNPAGFIGSGATVNPTVNQTTTYTVTVTDGNGCTGTGEIMAVVNEIPTTNFSSNSAVCENTDIELYDLHGGGSALNFDGNNDWIQANTLADDLAGSDFTVSMWMNTSGNNENYLFAINNSTGSDNKLLLGVENSTGKILIWNQKRSTILVNDGGWHHVAMSFNNSSKEVIVYVDGAKQFSVIMAGLTLLSSDKISIGQEYDTGLSLGNFHEGAIDEVRVWNSVRSQQEIQDWIWRELDPGQYSNMYAYYNFNEGSGTTANDLTGNGNNGTLKNGTTTANGPQWINADWRAHSWTGPNSFSSFLSNPVIPTASMLAEGIYNCTVSLLGCSGVSSNTVVDMDPVGTEPNITPISSSCENSAAFNLSADIPGGIWTGTGITDPVNGTFDPTLAGVGQHEVIYTTTGGGCLGDDTISINVLPEISLTTSENTLVCDGGNMQLFSGCNHTMVFGTDDYININPVASEITNSDFTFSTWIKSNIASGSGNLFAVNTSFGDNRFLVMVNSASGLLELFDGSAHIASTTTVNDDQWHQIVVTYNNTTKQAQTYVDGNPEMLVNLSGMPATGVSATDLVSLGQEYDPGPVASDFFTGKMDEARIWNVLVGQTEISSWMNTQLNDTHPDYANLVAYYTFNDNDNNVLYDYSPAGNNGTIVNTNGYLLSDIPGFTDPCSYSWSSVPVGFNSVLADQMVTPGGIVTYHVSVTNDLGCVAFDSVAVAELVFEPTVVSSNSPVCEGLDIELYDSTAAGNALSFDGNNDWLEINSLTDDITGSDFTFSCWFRAGSQTGTAGAILGINDPTTINKNRLIVGVSSTTQKLMLFDSTTTIIPVNSPIVTDNQWRHLAVTFETGTKKLEIFLNGLLIDQMILDNIISSGVGNNDLISIGQEFDGNHSDFFSGKIDEIRFWDTKLTQTDILDWLYRPLNNTHPQYGNLIGYYPINGSSTTVNDESGNGNNATKMNGTSTGGGPSYTLSDWRTQNWSGPGIFSSTAQNPVITSATPANDGTYDMYFTVLGCDSPSESTIVVIQPNALDPTITPAGPFCSSDGASSLIAATPGGTWFGSGITDTLLGTFDPNVAGSGMHQVIYVADDCAGSSDTITIEVVAPIISILISNDPMSCGTATGSIQIGGSGTGDVSWSGTSSGNANNVSLPYTITGLTAGSYTITYTDGNGCISNTLAQSLSDPSLPVIAIGGTTICEGQSVNISASGATSYSWDNGLGTGSNQTVSPTTTTTYTVTGTTMGCSGTDQLTITVIPLPSVVAAGTTTICEGQSTTIDATGATSYTWDQGLGAGATQIISPTTTTTYTVTGTTAGCTNTDQVTVTVTPLPTVIASGTATICEGQSTIIDATGATSYSWDQGLGAGAFQTVSPTTTTTYTITGITAGCSNTDQVTVTVTPLPALIASGTTTICEGQSTTIDATGATSYSWDQGLGTGSTQVVSPTTTTIYTVTGTTTGCTNTDQVTVTVTPLPTVVASGTTTICEGQSTVIDATGATSYSWDQGLGAGGVQTVSPTSTITYTVTGTMTGCTNTDQVTVTVNPAPFISVDLVTDVLCYGDLSGSIDISVSGGITPYDYLWNSGQITEDLSGIPAGNYNVSVTGANGCLSVANATVDENPEIVLSAVVGDELFDGEGSIDLTVTGGTAPYLYNWSNGESTEDLSYLHSGTYTVVVTDANGCIDSLTVEVGSQVGIDEIGNNKLISVYPNPTKGKIYVQINGDVNDETIAVYDSAGKRVMSVLLDGTLTEIKLETLERGVYLLNLERTEYFYRVTLH